MFKQSVFESKLSHSYALSNIALSNISTNQYYHHIQYPKWKVEKNYSVNLDIAKYITQA